MPRAAAVCTVIPMTQPIRDPRTEEPRPPQPSQDQPSDRPARESRMERPPDFGETTYRGLGRLEGKVALITGGDSGIGRAVAVAFAREGADVLIAYLNEEQDAQETARVVRAAGCTCITMAGDISQQRHCQQLVERTLGGWEPPGGSRGP